MVDQFVQAFSVDILKEALQSDQLPVFFQKVPALYTIEVSGFIADRLEVVQNLLCRIQGTVLQEMGDDILCQSFITRVICLIPDVTVFPLQLVTLRRSGHSLQMVLFE